MQTNANHIKLLIKTSDQGHALGILKHGVLRFFVVNILHLPFGDSDLH